MEPIKPTEPLSHISDLPDEVLVSILWPSDRRNVFRAESDGLWGTFRGKQTHLNGNPRLEDVVNDTSDDPLLALPISADPAHNLLIASICRRWRGLAKLHVATLVVRENRVVSRPDLADALTCFPNLTRLHLSDGSIDTIDDAFLAHVAASCPKLTNFHVGKHNLRSTSGYGWARDKAVTEAGLDRFIRRCTRLEQLSLRSLHRGADLPASFFQLTRLRSLALAYDGSLSPGLRYFSALTALCIDEKSESWATFSMRASSLLHLTSLARLDLPTNIPMCEAFLSYPDGSFSFAQLQSLESLKVSFECASFSRIIPPGAPYTRLKRLEFVECFGIDHLLDGIGELLPSLEELVATLCRFTHLPDEFASLSRLHTLKIFHCSLSSLPRNFGELPVLKTLVLHYVWFSNLPDSFCQLTSLETLFLIGCTNLLKLPGNFASLSGLKTLRIMHMPELSLPEEIGGLANLRTFVLHSSCTTEPRSFHPSFSHLTSLTRLELDQCMIAMLPEGMENLTRLQELHVLSCPNISEIPDSLTALVRLEVARVVDCNGVISAPRRLDGLTRLKQLDLSGCEQLQEAPESLPSSLERLSLGNHKWSSRLPEISMLSNLETLRLGIVSNTEKIAAGASFPRLKHLEVKVAQHSAELPFPLTLVPNLRSLTVFSPICVKENSMSTLSWWDMSDRFSHLPASLTDLQQLTSLEIHAAKLASLPEGIGALSRLRRLDLSECSYLTRLPDSLTRLSCLHELNLSNTPGTVLPPNIAQLTRLKSLNLRDCACVNALPDELTSLQVLEKMDAGGRYYDVRNKRWAVDNCWEEEWEEEEEEEGEEEWAAGLA